MTTTARSDIEATTLPVSHPLEPLTGDEIAAAAAVLRDARLLPETARVVQLSLREPPKDAILAAGDGVPELPRRVFAMLHDQQTGATHEAVVSLSEDSVESWRTVPGVQPPISVDEFMACEQLLQTDPRWQEAMRLRGITDFSLTMVDPWAAGYTGPDDDPERRRIARPLTFVRSEPDDNGYARPVEGVIGVVDLDRFEVIDVEDHGVVPLPPRPGNYEPELMRKPGNVPAVDAVRDDLRTIEITQPDGPSFAIDGHHVRWQKWSLRVGYTPREGLVIHDVRYHDRDRVRPILYRASVSEMYIPYGDPGPTHRIKNVFDEGEYGLGFMLNSLELGCDCLGLIRYFDVVVNDKDGQPMTIPQAICLHEEDAGVSWKHTDFRTDKGEVRRLRRLVISSFATVGNYEYGFFWYFYTDGAIRFEVKLTGVLSTGAIEDGEQPEHGTLVAPGLYAPHHQHFFNVRLDMCVDGTRNSVYEVDAVADPAGDDNPGANAWRAKTTMLATESEAQRLVDPLVGRYWLISNPHDSNHLGRPTAYKLLPGENVLPPQGPGSQAYTRGGFAYKHLWVTPYDDAQRFAAGDYPYQSPGGGGLPEWSTADRCVADTDLVVWYTMGAHHVARPEDWPVMPVSTVGFGLAPSGFFDGNPALDVPPTDAQCHVQ